MTNIKNVDIFLALYALQSTFPARSIERQAIIRFQKI